MSANPGKTARVLGVTIAAGALLFGGANASAAPLHEVPAAPTAPQVVVADQVETDVTGKNIQQVMDTSQQKPVVIKVGTEWCGPCQELAPVISGFAHDDAGKWLLGKVDGDKSPDLVDRFKVEGYPTMIGIYKGKEVSKRMIGYDGNPQSVRTWIDSILQAGGQR